MGALQLLTLVVGLAIAGLAKGATAIGLPILANAAGTFLGALLLAGLDQKTFAILITAMVALFLLRGGRIVGEPGARRAQLLTPVVGFAGGIMQGTTSISSPVIGSFFHAMNLPPRE